jgi:hypothetical protein
MGLKTSRDYVNAMEKALGKSKQCIERAKSRMKRRWDKNTKTAPNFAKGDWVLLDARSYPPVGPVRKLS